MSYYLPGTQSISNVNRKVGINTLTPSTELDINGTLTSTSGVFTSSLTASNVTLSSVNVNTGTISNLSSNAATISTLNVTSLTNEHLVLNKGKSTVDNAGLIISQLGFDGEYTGAYMLVNDLSDGWVCRVGGNDTVNLNQDIGRYSSPEFTDVTLLGKLTAQTGVFSNITATTGTLTNIVTDKLTMDTTVLTSNNNLLSSTTAIYVPGVTVSSTGVAYGPTGVYIYSSSTGSPYPATINISNTLKYTECDMSVVLGGCDITTPSSLRVLLTSPNGKSILLMSDLSVIANSGANVYLTFLDQGGAFSDTLTSGTYAPTGTTSYAMPYPAPAGPYVTSLSELTTGDINGDWKLYVEQQGSANPEDVINYVVLQFYLSQQSTIGNLSSTEIVSDKIYVSEYLQTTDFVLNNDKIHMGSFAGSYLQSTGAIAIGYQSGNNNQGDNSIAIGYQTATDNQGKYSIAIGHQVGYYIDTPEYSIILNASSGALDVTDGNALYIQPIRDLDTNSSTILSYDTSTKEVYTTSNVLLHNAVVNNNYCPRKWYSFNSSYANNTGSLGLTFTFDNPSFVANIDAILNKTDVVNEMSVAECKVIGGTQDGSSPSVNLFASNYAVLNNTGAPSFSWTGTNPVVTPTTVILYANDSYSNLVYSVNVEVIKGTLLSIQDNDTTPNSILFDY